MNKKWALGVLLLAALSCRHVKGGASQAESIQDVQQMTIRQPQGDYQVTCRDGTVEFASPEKVLRNDVCTGTGTTQDVVCIAVSGGFVPTATKNGTAFGLPMPEKDCRAATAAARYGAVCGNSGGYGPFRISDGTQLGQMSSIGSCVAATAGARHGVVCTGKEGETFMINIASGRKYGDRIRMSECLENLSGVRYETMCSLTNNQYFITNIISGRTYGEGRGKADCLTANSSASPHAVCIGRRGGWVVARGVDGSEMGEPMQLSDCTLITKSVREETLCSKGGGVFFPTSIGTGTQLGNIGGSRDECLELVSTANFKVVCAKANSGGYIPTRILDGGELGQAMAKEACKASTSAIQRDMICTYQNGTYFPSRIDDGRPLGAGSSLDLCLKAVANGVFPRN